MAGLTTAGFERKRLPQLLAELGQAYQDKFGSTLDVSPQSVTGQQIGIHGQREADLWELMEQLYLAGYASSAEGVSLDGAMQRVGVIRLGLASSVIPGSLTGVQGTPVPAGSLARTAGDQYSLLADVTIDVANADRVRAQIGAIALDGVVSVTIDGTTVEISASSAVSDSVAAQLAAAVNAAAVHATAVADGANVDILAKGAPINVTVDGSGITVIEIASQGVFQATVAGPLDVSPSSLKTIVTPVAGWNGVTNRIAGIQGRIVETDGQAQQRRRSAVRGLGSGSPASIKARLQNAVPNILSAQVYENRTSAPDIFGRPASSYEVVVDGGDTDAVAQALWTSKPASVEMFGNTTVSVLDANGSAQNVKFSRPAPVYVWVNVKIDNFYTEEKYPPNGPRLIAEGVANQGNTLQTGNDVIRQRLLAPVYAVPGIKDATITLATSATAAGPPGVFAEVSLSISGSQRASFDPSRVNVL